MKKLILLFLIIPSVTFGQNTTDSIFPLKEGVVNYTEVVKIDSTTKNELYINAKKWIANNYKSANDVIQLDDKEAGEIIAKGYFEMKFVKSGLMMEYVYIKIYHTIKITMKDGKYKYEVTDFKSKSSDGLIPEYINNDKPYPKYWTKKILKHRQDCNVEIIKTIDNLKTALALRKKVEDF